MGSTLDPQQIANNGHGKPLIAAAAEELVAAALQNGRSLTGPIRKSASGIQQFTDPLLAVHHSVTEALYPALSSASAGKSGGEPR
jgi:hypothetical protein